MPKILILGLGNTILKDDGIGIYAARILSRTIGDAENIEVIESSLAGLSILDLILGYEKVIIIDSILTGNSKPGTIHEFDLKSLCGVFCPSPHYADLSQILTLGNAIGLNLPREIKVFAVEAEDPYTFEEKLSDKVEAALPHLVGMVSKEIEREAKNARDVHSGKST